MTDLSRRLLLSGLAGGAALAPFLAVARAAAQEAGMTMEEATSLSHDAHVRLMEIPGLHMHGNEKVAMLLYPGFTALDLVGPHYFFACMMGAEIHLVTPGDALAPVPSDLTLAIEPTITLADCPRDLDLVFVPGGTAGTLDAARNPDVLRFLREAQTEYMTSVCTGSVILGAAGLLRGKKATGHWVIRDDLERFGAEPVNQRVVRDGNVITGAGVSAGLDFALEVVAAMRGEPYAETLRLQAEYVPEPTVPGGSPETTNPAITEALYEMFAPFRVGLSELQPL